jgi:hypothetical protein
MTNLPIPEPLANAFCLGANAVNVGRAAMLAAMREYWDEASGRKGFSKMQMYEDFAALTEISAGTPTITARTIRYFWENTYDLPPQIYKHFTDGLITFEHCEADKALMGQRGIERGQAIEWAINNADKGRKVASVKKMWLHFADENGKDYDTILLNRWTRRLDALEGLKLPETADASTRARVDEIVAELRRLIVKLFDNP